MSDTLRVRSIARLHRQLAGASYMEVHQAGGGINFTVERTRAASEEDLLQALLPRLQRMLRAGTWCRKITRVLEQPATVKEY